MTAPPWVPPEIRWLSIQVRPYLRWHFASFFCVTTGSFLAVITPLVLKWLIDEILPQRQTGLLLCAVMLIFIGNEGHTALASFGNYLTWIAIQRMILRVRLDLLLHADRLSADYYESATPGAVMYFFKEPVDEVAYFGSDLLPAILRTTLSTGVMIGTMFILSPGLTWVVLPLIPIFLIMRQYFRKRLMSDSDHVQLRLADWSRFLTEHLSSILCIQLLGREERQERVAFRLLARSARSQVKLFQSILWFTAGTSFVLALAMSAAIGYGGWKVIVGTLSLGSMVAYFSFVAQLFEPLSGVADLYARAQKVFASIRQLQCMLSLQPSVADASKPRSFPPHDWEIRFNEVVFGYSPQREALCVPMLRISAGEKVAIVGENGAGKSTLARLIARAYDVNQGSISIGDTDIRSIRLRDLRQRVCYLPRDPVLFDGTLISNLRFVAPGASDSAVREALRQADLAVFLETLPGGYQQWVGPNGCQLSGGQRQRLAIARAILQRPSILILDEATSCLDLDSETRIFQHLRSCLSFMTVIVVSHRGSTVSTFDRVLFLSEGRVVADRIAEAPPPLTPSF
ncbi:MAG TPA: ABC transporter ATP-binding protein [Terriglobales bacterium]|nr:ABC transporter ATP-binding protein [Terriglobales bacterium]